MSSTFVNELKLRGIEEAVLHVRIFRAHDTVVPWLIARHALEVAKLTNIRQRSCFRRSARRRDLGSFAGS